MPDFPVIEFVLSDFYDDTPEVLDSMIEYDYKWGQYDKVFIDDNQNKNVKDSHKFKEILKKYYLPLKNVFLVLQSESVDLKNIEIKQFADFCSKICIFDKEFKPEDLAKCYLDSNTDEDVRLNRNEFIGALIRMAMFKYRDSGKMDTISKSFEKLLLEDILNRSQIAQGIYFRHKNVTESTLEIFSNNDDNL